MHAIANSFSHVLPLLAQAEEILPDVTRKTAPGAAGDGSGWMVWLIAFALIGVSWWLASTLARVWRMQDYQGRFFALIFAFGFGLAICVPAYLASRDVPAFKNAAQVKLGVDLSGGVILVYELDTERMTKKDFDAADIKSVQAGLDTLTKTKPTLKATASIDPTQRDRILVAIEGATLEDTTAITNMFTQPGLLPNETRTMKINQTDKEMIFQLQPALSKGTMDDLVSGLSKRINPGGQKEITVRPFGESQVEIIIPQTDATELDVIKQNISTAGTLEFRIMANRQFTDHQALIAAAEKTEADLVLDNSINPPTKLGRWVDLSVEEAAQVNAASDRIVTRQGRAGRMQALVHYDPIIGEITGDSLYRAFSDTDPETSKPQISFVLKGVGTNRFAELTRKYTNPGLPTEAQLAILLNDEIATAPNLKSAITGGSGRITGNFTQPETQRIAGVLNSGKLPATLKKTPVQEETISAQLGADTIRSGAIAMGLATLAVLIFMWFFYGFCGLVADICVLLNVLLVVALMIPLKAALTLSGLAGLVLSVGMAVDANVLIFERMREEVARGSALKMAIRNGFSRAMSTVVDSNLTTLISGVVLFAIGSDQLKGFATTLILGLILNLFTAVYCSRIIFDVSERRGWFKKLNMMRLVGETKFDFVGPVKACVAVSLVLIVAGLAVGAARGKNFFDIDFTGGSTVQIVMTEAAAKADPKPSVEMVRKSLDGKLPDVEISEVTNTAGVKLPQYKIVTSENELAKVKQTLTAAFGDKLEHYHMGFANVGRYVAPVKTSVTTPKSPVTPKTDASNSETPKSDAPKIEPAPVKTETPAPVDASKTPEAPANSDPKTPETKTFEPAAGEKTVPADGNAPEAKTPDAKTPDAKTPEANLPEQKQSSRIGGLRYLWAANPLALNVFGRGLLLQDEKKDTPEKSTPPAESKAEETKAEPAKSEPATSDAGKPDPAKSEPSKAETPAGEAKTMPEPTKAADPIVIPPVDLLKPASRYKSQAELNFSIDVSYQYLLGTTAELLNAKNIVVADYDFRHTGTVDTTAGISKNWTIISSAEPDRLETIVKDLQAGIDAQPAFSQISNIGGAVADNAKYNALWALLVSMAAIVVYVWFRFQNVVFGFAAVIALVHDVLITIGALAVSYYIAPAMGWAMVDPFKISLEVVAALLTIIGFSINDTIVIFDRIRELRGKSPDITPDMVNRAVNQTLGRTILTSGTVFMVTLILYIFGGEEIHPFSFAMLIGLISGTYSTVYIAAPIVLWFRKKQPVAVAPIRNPVVVGRGR